MGTKRKYKSKEAGEKKNLLRIFGMRIKLKLWINFQETVN